MYKFRDLFAFVNGTGDKANCKIFVNGPIQCRNAYCMLWPRERSEKELASASASERFPRNAHVQPISVQVVDTCGAINVFYSELPDNYILSLSRHGAD